MAMTQDWYDKHASLEVRQRMLARSGRHAGKDDMRGAVSGSSPLPGFGCPKCGTGLYSNELCPNDGSAPVPPGTDRCSSCGHVAATCDGYECYWCPEGYCEDRAGTAKAENDFAADLSADS